MKRSRTFRLQSLDGRRRGLVFATAFLLCAAYSAATALAQLPQTQLSCVAPSGAKAGSTVDVKVVAGANLEDLTDLKFNHAGIKATPKMTESGGKKTPVANTFVVTIAGNVPTGLYEVRAVGKYGMSNPRTFVIGKHDESTEKESNNTLETANEARINQTVNGAISGAADIDCFRFAGKKGQRIVVDCRAARIDSRLRAAMELFAPNGRRIRFDRNSVRKDPLIAVTLPLDGAYTIKLYDFTYRGGAEYFYRLSVHTSPHVDFVMPAAGVPGTTQKFTLYGRNLPGSTPAGKTSQGEPLEKLEVSVAIPADSDTFSPAENLLPHESVVDGFRYVLQTPIGDSNPVFIQFAGAPVVLEQEPNDDPAKPQKITIPTEVAGRFQQRGDIDYFTFEAKAKEVYRVEVYGHRAGSTADPYLILERITKDKKGVEKSSRITAQDDTAAPRLPRNTFNPFLSGTDDPIYRFQVPADGTYRISVRDRYFEARGGPKLVYRLAIRKFEPDFKLIVLPETPPARANQPTTTGSIALRRGENIGVRVTVFRRDGFDGPVDIKAEGLPEGVVCKGASIDAASPETKLIFSCSEKARKWSGMIRVVGTARIEDPAKAKAVTSAQAALKAAENALPKLRQDVVKAESAAKKANDTLQQAEAALAKKEKDKQLASRVAKAKAEAAKLSAALKSAKGKLAAAEKKVADAKTAVAKAESDLAASRRTVKRLGRPATIVWNGTNQIPAVSRVARSLGLSVIDEAAPFQVTTDVFRVEANQGRQILIPVKLQKRSGFDKQVTMTFVGLPRNTNVTAANKNIAKGKDGELLRVFVNNNAKPGTYTLYLDARAQVAYRKNVERAEQAKKNQAAAAKAATAAAAKAKTAAQTAAAAVKKATDAANKAKAADAAKTAAAGKAAAAATALKAAEAAKTKSEQNLSKADAALKAAQAKADAAKAAAAKKPKDKKLADAKAAAEKVLAAAIDAQKKAAQQKTASDKTLAASQKANADAAAALKAAEKNAAAAAAAAKAAQAARVKADADSKAAATAAKNADAAKKAADRALTAANNASKPKNINVAQPSTPVVIVVKKGAATLSASVPGGGAIKKGGKLDVKVTVKRINGFTGPVTLSLPLPPGIKGISAAPVTIPADKTTGTLTIQAAGDATTGQLANMVIRGTMSFDGKAAVDSPITLKVSK